jgi:hypothetical protein
MNADASGLGIQTEIIMIIIMQLIIMRVLGYKF